MKTINFSYNWNNKLDCKAFTTLRLSNRNKYKIGETYAVNLKSKFIKNAQIIDIKTIWLHQINDYITYLDTGYNKEECINIIKKMYKSVDFTKTKMDFILIKEE